MHKQANNKIYLIVIIALLLSGITYLLSSCAYQLNPPLPTAETLVSPTVIEPTVVYTPNYLPTSNSLPPTGLPGIVTMASNALPQATPTLIPLVNKTEPLPHNGLFIRRNNQFGTKLSSGIKDLIEQGVMIDQTAIRFDDFIALSIEPIPTPSIDNSIAVSFGISAIPSNLRHDDRATHYLEIALRTSDSAPTLDKEPPTVNFVLVIDTSGSMEGEKLDIVKASIRELFSKMRDDDVIGIVEFNEQARTILRATHKKNISQVKFNQLISNLHATGGTDINIGLQFGIDEISRLGNNGIANNVFLFSDGNPTSGEINWLKIRQNVSSKIRELNTHVSTFAFGSDANTRELDALAGMTGGSSIFVLDPKSVEIDLGNELDRRQHFAAINIQMRIEIDEDIPIYHFYGHDLVEDPITREAVLHDIEAAKEQAQSDFGVVAQSDIVTEEKGVRLFIPDLAVGETYLIVLEIAPTRNRIGTVTIQYTDTLARKNELKPISLSSEEGNLSSDLIVRHALGLWTSEVVYYALDDLYQEDIETATKRIQAHISILESANLALPSEYLEDDVITLRKFLSLAQNLGQIRNPYDDTATRTGTLLVNSLNAFGNVRDGFDRMDYSPNP